MFGVATVVALVCLIRPRGLIAMRSAISVYTPLINLWRRLSRLRCRNRGNWWCGRGSWLRSFFDKFKVGVFDDSVCNDDAVDRAASVRNCVVLAILCTIFHIAP